MATREEKVVHIEKLLRDRFFPLVEKAIVIGREGWSEEQHDTDRLSRALSAYVVAKRCDVDAVTAVGAITDGSNDGGIDALFFDRKGQRLLVVQAKYKVKGNAPAQDEVIKTIDGVRALLSRRFDSFNDRILAQRDDIEDALDTPGVKVCLAFTFLNDEMNLQPTGSLNTFCHEQNQADEIVCWQVEGLSTLYEWIIAEQAPSGVDGKIVLENWSSVSSPHRAFYGQIRATELAALVARHGEALLQGNIRHYLGPSGVNSAIEQTVRHQPEDFFYLNNGITAIAMAVKQAAGTMRRCAFNLQGFSIVNGAQTAETVARVASGGVLSPDASVLITIIETGAESMVGLGSRITRARNYQNVMVRTNFAALDPNQERLRRELASVGVTYYYRQSAEAAVRREDAFTIEEAALAVACLGFQIQSGDERVRRPQPVNALALITTAKGEPGRLADRDATVYRQLFPGDLSGIRVYRAVQVYRFVDQILAGSERAEGAYARRMFFRHARYFIMAFLAREAGTMLDRVNLALSPSEQDFLSRQTNELAELIYQVSVPRQEFKGYLAIFRNPTECQPLADAVLNQLAQANVQRSTA